MTTRRLVQLEKRYKARCGRLSAYYYQMRDQLAGTPEYWTLQYGRDRVSRGSVAIYRELNELPVREVMLARTQERKCE